MVIVDFVSVILGGIFGLLGAILVAVVSPFLGHKLEIKKIKEETFFRKKLEYFEKVCELVQERVLLYIQLMAAIQYKTPNLQKMLKNLFNKNKADLTRYLPKAAPLYFNDTKRNLLFNNKVTEIVILELNVYKEIEKTFKKARLTRKKLIVDETPSDLFNSIATLSKSSEEIIMMMKEELRK